MTVQTPVDLDMRTEVFKRRLAGETFYAISKAVKRSDKRVRAIYHEMLAEYESPLVDEVRNNEDAVILAMRAAAWDRAMSGDEKAIACVLRTVDQRCKLHGANAPEIHDVNVNVIEVTQAEIARLRGILGREAPSEAGSNGSRAVGAASRGAIDAQSVST